MSPRLETIVALFAKKEKRERLLLLAANARRRSDFCDALLHDTRSLDRSLATRLETSDAHLDGVLRKLRGTDESPAYAVSAIAELDNRELPLGDALRASIGSERDTIVLCLDTLIAFYENHEGEQFVLARPARGHRGSPGAR